MTQERLNGLKVISIEHDIVRQINFDDVINDFVNAKARKVLGLLWTLGVSVSVRVHGRRKEFFQVGGNTGFFQGEPKRFFQRGFKSSEI